ncbi:MAG: hypothetical protein LBR65_07070 [Culturomica sp.]|jgi:hypothetical protein|nr:hypothetical protein [Culturomica sp.]
MKRLIFFIILFNFSFHGLAKENNYFKYDTTEKFIHAHPLFEPHDPRKEEADVFIIKNYEQLNEAIKNIVKNILSTNEIQQLNKENYSTVMLYFNYKGEIEYISFVLSKSDIKLFTDQKLYKLYQLIKAHGVNMNWGEQLPQFPKKRLRMGFWLFKSMI